MKIDFMYSQIDQRRQSDNKMFQDAFSDLLSVIGINTPKVKEKVRGAIVDILHGLGKEAPEVPENITDLDSQLEYMLRPSHTMRRRVELLGKWWKDASGAFLGSTKDGEVVAIVPGKWSGYEYTDSNGNRVKINSKTAQNINVDAFCFYDAFPLEALKMKDLAKFMFSHISKADFVYIVVMAIIAQLLGMLSPYTTHIIYNVLIPSGAQSLFFVVASFMIGLTIGKGLIEITRSVVMNRFQSKLDLSLNSALMIRLFSLPTTFFKNYTSGELASRMGYIASLSRMIVEAVISVGLSTFFALGYIFQMGAYAPTLVVPGLIIVFVKIFYTVLNTLYQQKFYKKRLDIAPKLQSLTYSLFGGMQKIKVTGAEKRAFAKWANIYSDVEKLTYSPPMILKLSSVIHLIISVLGTMALYYYAVSTKVDFTNYMSFSTAYGAVAGAITTLSGVALRFANLGPILDMIKPVMEEKPESSLGRKIPTQLSGDIEVNNVSFKYTPDGPIILDNISLKIKKGEYVAIVGTTGCGKSTLLRILLGFETPEKGAVYYGGKDLATLDLRTVRQKIGVVMQNGSLFPGDIFSNIIVTSPWKTMDDAWEAARMAGIEEDIKAMPMGMHTLISEGGGGISGGQKQRLMIARAIIAKPSILYFDEATSALDNITQQHVANSISSLKSTRLVIAHRLSTIKNCDRILVMDKGKIAESGTYDELMDKKGMFYELAIRQIANEK